MSETTQAPAVVVLGMHRSGTSCVAGMLAASGVGAAGAAVRNWDNARGHHEMLDAIRLDEAVLAYSGGHWLSPPAEVRWTDEHAAARDRLLSERRSGRPPLVKDPRMLLVMPFWRASRVPFHAIGVVRHPVAAARSLESWRETPLAEGIALWTAHNRALAEDRARHGYAVVDFDRPKAEVVAAVRAAAAPIAADLDTAVLAAAYDGALVHHDDADAPQTSGLAEALALHRTLAGAAAPVPRAPFPRAELASFARLAHAGDLEGALAFARLALAAVGDAAAVLIPVVTALLRRRADREALALIREQASRLERGLADLLLGKVHLAAGDAASAVRHLEAACAVTEPYFQARHQLALALHAVDRRAEARAAMHRVASEALYPHGPLATLAEWAWLAGDRDEALAAMARAIAVAPPHRRGRLRTRRAEWLVAAGDRAAARAELGHALAEDPGYARSRDVLARLA